MAHFSEELGTPVPDWQPPHRPGPDVMQGRYARLERLRPDHAAGLFPAFDGADDGWRYMANGPFADEAAFSEMVRDAAHSDSQAFYAIQDAVSGAWRGLASYLRIDPAAGSIEVGSISYAPSLQRTRAATEAMFLMMQWAFEAGYRRYEWKCNALNRASRAAAQRYGFSYEGVFRQALVVKGRNRDTAWFACIDTEWPALKAAFQTWLAPENFDAEGRQRQRLSDLTAPVLVARDPGG